MPDRTVIQWDENDIDALGLTKVDVLGLGMLSCLRRALQMVGTQLGKSFTMHEIPKDDKAVCQMLCRANAQACFKSNRVCR